MYQAERADLTAISNNALNLTSISLAYIAGSAAVWATRGDSIPLWVIPWLPVPLWAFLAFHVLIMAKVWVHNVSIHILEAQLNHAGELPPAARARVGRNAARTVVDLPDLWTRDRWPFAAATIISYGGGAVIALAYAVLCIWPAWQSQAWVYASLTSLVNLSCVALLVSAWVNVFRISDEKISRWNGNAK